MTDNCPLICLIYNQIGPCLEFVIVKRNIVIYIKHAVGGGHDVSGSHQGSTTEEFFFPPILIAMARVYTGQSVKLTDFFGQSSGYVSIITEV